MKWDILTSVLPAFNKIVFVQEELEKCNEFTTEMV